MTLLRLKRAINEPQYQAAFVDIVCNRRAQLRRSTAPVTWLNDSTAEIDQYRLMEHDQIVEG